MRAPDRQPFLTPGPMTSLGPAADQLDDLPDDVTGLAAVLHGLLVHEFLGPLYDITIDPERQPAVHRRPAAEILSLTGDEPLARRRAPDRRVPSNCRQFSVVMVALLRAKGIPARARCGFGGYFPSGWFEDHWVAEHWSTDEERWVLVDAQIDDVQRAVFPIDFDVTDVPRDRFVVAGDAWARCRRGEDDPDRYGLSVIPESGDWWIAANLVRDAASLAGVEMLPWDVWGAMPTPDTTITADLTALFDLLAELTVDPDEAALAELRRLAADDDRVRVPTDVYNAARDRMERVRPS